MSAWGKSDNKSSAGTVTLTAPAITFNAATGHAAGVYTSAGHPFQLGDPVAYANGGGTSVVGLTTGSTYYVTNVTADTFSLAATEAGARLNVPAVIASTDGVGASHTFTRSLALGRGTLTGTDTFFATDNAVGDVVRVGNQEMIFTAIASDTSATVINANPGTTLTAFAGEEHSINEKPTSIASISTTDFESTQVFGVRSTEIHGDQSGGYISAVALIQGGSGYTETPTVAFSGGGGSSAAATATISGGAVTAIAVTNNGSSYETAPTVSIDVPRRTIATSAVDTTAETITYTTHGLETGDTIKYYNGGGTTLAGLTHNTSYFAIKIDANTFKVATSTANATAGTAVNLTGTGNNAQYFDLLDETTAAANAALGVNQGVDNAESGAVAHTGWVKRKVLTGAHAGRIQYEVLVAMSKNGITSDAADDVEFPED